MSILAAFAALGSGVEVLDLNLTDLDKPTVEFVSATSSSLTFKVNHLTTKNVSGTGLSSTILVYLTGGVLNSTGWLPLTENSGGDYTEITTPASYLSYFPLDSGTQYSVTATMLYAVSPFPNGYNQQNHFSPAADAVLMSTT